MDRLWNPWRYRYITAPKTYSACVFCAISAELGPENDEANLIVYRGVHNFVVLNLYPYTAGHLLIVPYAHVSELSGIDDAAASEMMDLTRRAERHLRALYRPSGLNLGMNLGESAGAGIAAHIHMHVLPRWHGDANFLSVIGETRILPEELPVTWRRVRDAFAEGA